MNRIAMSLLVLALAVGFSSSTFAGDKQNDKSAASTDTAKQTRWQGTIVRTSEDKSSMTIRGGRGGGRQNFERTVLLDHSTEWTKQGKPADQGEFKDGSFVIVVGNIDDQGKLHAQRVDLRLPR